jgi:hypothetical protein
MGYHTQKTSSKRRPTITINQIQTFTNLIQNILKKVPRKRVLNMDETCWKTVAGGFFT